MSTVVTLYGRPECCLCDEARAVLLEVGARRPFELVERDIEQDPELHRRYLERIPVVAVDGVEQFEFFVDRARLEELLSASGATAVSGRGGGSVPMSRRPHTHL